MIRDLIWGGRQAFRHPRGTFACVVILALTCAAATALFSTAGPLWLSPFPFPEPDRLVMLWEEPLDRPNPGYTTSFGLFSTARNELADVADLALSRPTLPVLWLEGRAAGSLAGARVSANFLRVLGARPAHGRDFRPEDQEPGSPLVVLISHRVWRDRFGSRADLENLDARLDFGLSTEPVRVVGVLPEKLPIDRPLAWNRLDVLTVLPRVLTPEQRHFESRSYRMLARLTDGADLATLRRRGATTARSAAETYPPLFEGWGLRVEPASALAIAPYRKALRILAALTLLVMIAACANIGILYSARYTERAEELDVRAALGAGPWAIYRLLLIEGLLLAALALPPGLLGAWALLRQLGRLSGDPRLQTIEPGPSAVVFAAALCAFMAALFTLLPRFGRREKALSLRLGSRSPRRQDRRLRRLLSLETAAGVLILTASFTVTLGFLRLAAIDPGFSAAEVLTVTLRQSTADGDRQDPSLYETARRALERLPEVRGAGAVRLLPMSGSTFSVEAEDENGTTVMVALDGVGPGAFETLGIPLLAGRGVEPSDLHPRGDSDEPSASGGEAGEHPVWISESLARRLSDDASLGRRLELSFTQNGFRIAGVVGDIHRLSLVDAPQPTAYVTYPDFSRLHAHLVLEVEDPEAAGLHDAVRQTLAAVDHRLVVEEIRPLQQLVDATTERERITAFLCAALALLGLALTTSGAWAVTVYRVERRRRESGIRLALGASPRELRRSLVRQTSVDAAWGVAAGWVAALPTVALTSKLLLEGARPGLIALPASSAWLILLAAVAAYLAARGLRSVDPSELLREE